MLKISNNHNSYTTLTDNAKSTRIPEILGRTASDERKVTNQHHLVTHVLVYFKHLPSILVHHSAWLWHWWVSRQTSYICSICRGAQLGTYYCLRSITVLDLMPSSLAYMLHQWYIQSNSIHIWFLIFLSFTPVKIHAQWTGRALFSRKKYHCKTGFRSYAYKIPPQRWLSGHMCQNLLHDHYGL